MRALSLLFASLILGIFSLALVGQARSEWVSSLRPLDIQLGDVSLWDADLDEHARERLASGVLNNLRSNFLFLNTVPLQTLGETIRVQLLLEDYLSERPAVEDAVMNEYGLRYSLRLEIKDAPQDSKRIFVAKGIDLTIIEHWYRVSSAMPGLEPAIFHLPGLKPGVDGTLFATEGSFELKVEQIKRLAKAIDRSSSTEGYMFKHNPENLTAGGLKFEFTDLIRANLFSSNQLRFTELQSLELLKLSPGLRKVASEQMIADFEVARVITDLLNMGRTVSQEEIDIRDTYVCMTTLIGGTLQ